MWRGGDGGEADRLALLLPPEPGGGGGLGAPSVAFPAISTGVYGYPVEDAAALAVATVTEVAPGAGVGEVLLVAFSDEDAERYRRLLGAGG